MENLVLNIEALIFASEQGISADEIQQLMQTVSGMPVELFQVMNVLDEIKRKYDDENLAIGLVNLGGGYQFLTKKKYHPVITQLQIQRSKKN